MSCGSMLRLALVMNGCMYEYRGSVGPGDLRVCVYTAVYDLTCRHMAFVFLNILVKILNGSDSEASQ
jgi:hypothetical protein